jgi:hypothetical protein
MMLPCKADFYHSIVNITFNTCPEAARLIASTPCSSFIRREIKLATSTCFWDNAAIASRNGPHRLPITLI